MTANVQDERIAHQKDFTFRCYINHYSIVCCIKMPLLELKHNIERKGSQLIYFVLEDDPLYARTIFEYVKNLNIPVVYDKEFINILRNHKISMERDNHLTSEGHRLMGQWFYDYLKERKNIEKK